jgi:hypothetical protein
MAYQRNYRPDNYLRGVITAFLSPLAFLGDLKSDTVRSLPATHALPILREGREPDTRFQQLALKT